MKKVGIGIIGGGLMGREMASAFARWCALTDVEVMPELVTANQGEAGIGELCELLLARGVEVEAGLLTRDDAHAFVRSGLAARCRRVLMEPLDEDPRVAVAHAAEMEEIVLAAGIALPQVHHGYGVACWAVNRRALARGHGIRTGLEDVAVLPDGTLARDNAELVAAALRMIRGSNSGPATESVGSWGEPTGESL